MHFFRAVDYEMHKQKKTTKKQAISIFIKSK